MLLEKAMGLICIKNVTTNFRKIFIIISDWGANIRKILLRNCVLLFRGSPPNFSFGGDVAPNDHDHHHTAQPQVFF